MTAAMAQMSELPALIEFGRFTVNRRRRELLADDRRIELGARAFDTLIALIEAGGTVLGKDELMRRVWPGQVVEESNLSSQVYALRKVFGLDRGLIRTVAGRGYQFTGEIHSPADRVATPPFVGPTNLPQALSELIGRETEARAVTDLVTEHRLLTLVGTGGIGKTRLGLAVARDLLPRFRDGVFIAELGPVSNPDSVPATVATAFGLTLPGPVSPESVASQVVGKRTLLLLDNCEHVIEAAAAMAETLLRAGPNLSLLATSREPLRAEGEHVHRVPPLEVPPEDARDAADILSGGAVSLFVSRAQAAEAAGAPDARVAATIAGICRRLDGIPLAIELAAARVAAFGIDGVAARLDDRFRLLTGGNRTALRRHQTLRATFDWSHELLTETERVVLRRLAVFAGAFTLEAVSAVAADAHLGADEVVDGVANLVAKSLSSAEVTGAVPHYRLLETTRAYARDKLVEAGELAQCARRHAEYHRDLFERAALEWQARPTAEWLAVHGQQADNLRAALDWAFSPGGDPAIAVALVIAAVPLWVSLSLLDEFRLRVQHALVTLESGPRPDPRRRMQLHAAVGWWLVYTRGPARETEAAWATALELAEHLGDAGYRLRALWGLWAGCITNGKFREALGLARRFVSAAERANPADRPIGDRMLGASLHYLGDQKGARQHLTHTPIDLGHLPADASVGAQSAPISSPPWLWWPRAITRWNLSATPALARVLWLQGFPDEAMRTVRNIVDDAVSIDHILSLCNVLAQAACPIALHAGDLEVAERFITMLLEQAARYTLDVFQEYGRCFKGMLLVKRGDVASGLDLLGPAVDELRREERWAQFHTAVLAGLAEGFLRAGRTIQGLDAIDEAFARSEVTGERWATAELLRTKGELLLMRDERKAAQEHFLQALDLARQQDALSWELRAALSAARFWHRQRKTTQARNLLAPVYGRFTEGFGTADLVAARTLLDSLS
jgi:predicted ATPase/DNA-binding winged helix-turn-helix (wHTH) protein